MDRTEQVLDELESRAQTRTLREIESRGRSTVKVIRPSEIAGLIQEAVERTVERSGYVSPEKVDELVGESRTEFKQLVAERDRDRCEREELIAQVESLKADLGAGRERIGQLEAELDQARTAPADQAPAADAAGGIGAELLVKLMSEITDLKSQVAAGGQAAGGQGGGSDTAALIEKVVGSLDKKIEKLGKKVGITDAVEAEQVQLDAIFAKDDSGDFESNMENVKVKESKGAGIAANLERLRKLKK